MKRLLIAILIVSMVQGVFAQKIEIKGTIRNATDNEATEFVNVVLQTTDSVFVMVCLPTITEASSSIK